MKTIYYIIWSLFSILCFVSCATTYQPSKTDSNQDSLSNFDVNSNTSIQNTSGKQWFYIKTKTSETYLPYFTEPQYSERLGVETNLSMIKDVFISLDSEDELPNNLSSLPNLERLSISAGYDMPMVSFDFSIIGSLPGLKSLSLTKLIVNFSNSESLGNIAEIKFDKCTNTDFPAFFASSKLEKLKITNAPNSPFVIKVLPKSIVDIDVKGLVEEQEMTIISQLGHKSLHYSLPDKFEFYSEDYTVEQIFANKEKVIELVIELHRQSDEYINIVDQLPNLEYLYLVSSSANEYEGKTYTTTVLSNKIFECKKLKKFKLRSDRVQYIYGDFSKLTKLKSLVLDAPLTHLTDFKIDGLIHLGIDLNLNYFITDLDPSPIIDSTFNLKVDKKVILDRMIDVNQIIKNHSHLKSFEISGTVGHLGADKVDFKSFNEYKNLTGLSFAFLSYSDFPMFIINNPNLKALNLRLTNLKSIPKEIDRLSNLTSFNFKVYTEKLPDELYTLKKMKYLWINGSKVKSVSPLLDVNVFPDLRVLKIKDTGISKKDQDEIYKKRPNLETLWKPWED